jgi:formamidopyrimidine-DNA glycosylase
MPEIVEVRKYVAFIRKHTHNNMVKEINIINGRYKKHGPFEGYKKYVKDLPLKIKEVNSKGKFIYFIFENDWSDYDYKYAVKNKIIGKKFKRPSDYNRDFYIYWEEEDIHGNKVKT